MTVVFGGEEEISVPSMISGSIDRTSGGKAASLSACIPIWRETPHLFIGELKCW